MSENNNIEIEMQEQFIKRRLTNIRRSKRLTQKDMAKLTGLSTTTISNIENKSADSTYNVKSLIRYIEALGYEIYIDKKDEANDSEGTDKDVFTTSTE